MSPIIKYTQLKSKEWLHKKYVIEKLSSVEISKIVGCSAGSVIGALYRRGIETRSIKTTVHRGHKGFMCSLLDNPIWLKQKYIKEKLNSYEIAVIAGTNQYSVMRALQLYKIKTRSFSEAAINRKSFWRKYKELGDKEWLYQKYEVDKKSSTEIALLVGTTATNVIKALKKFKILIRTNSEASKLIKTKSKYKDLNDPHFLSELYIEKKLSTEEIANIIDAKSCNSVRQALIRHNIKPRNFREAQVHSRINSGFISNKAIIDGGLLGDASLRVYNRNSNISMPYYTRKNKHYEHVLWVAKQLITNTPEAYIKPIYTVTNGKKHKLYFFRTYSFDLLSSFFKRWYPETNLYNTSKPFMKIIPEDIDISPISLLHLFLDDGSSYRRKREKEKSFKKQVYIVLSLQGFPRDNLEMFCEKFKKEYGNDINIKTRPCYTGYGYLIEVSQGSYQKFMDIIGPCPEPLNEVFGYKWK